MLGTEDIGFSIVEVGDDVNLNDKNFSNSQHSKSTAEAAKVVAKPGSKP